MSKPKKPGTDLAALKARLAKKTKAAEPAPAAADVPPPGQVAQAPAADVPPPGQVAAPDVPPPAEPAPEAYAPPADVPPPGYVEPAAPDVPAPPQAYPEAAPVPGGMPQPEYAAPPQAQVPMAAPAPAPAPMGDPDDPFGSGGGGGGFDPDAGLIDSGGEVAPRGSKGLVVFAALLAAGLGGVAGFLGNKIIGTTERVDAGAAKGARMVEEVEAVSKVRKGIAINWDEVKETISKDPKAGAERVTTLLTEGFDKHPQVDALFGWQLASIHPMGIKKTFELYDETNRLKGDLSILAGFLTAHVDALKAAGGPTQFGVVFKSTGAVMVQAIQPLCGEAPAAAAEGEAPPKLDPATLKPCEDPSKAVAYKARTSVGADPKESLVMRGYDKGQMQLLLPEGGIYNYAVGLEPTKNALKIRDSLLTRVVDRLEAMNKAEKIALKALENYADNPTVDGEGSQPDPGGGEG